MKAELIRASTIQMSLGIAGFLLPIILVLGGYLAGVEPKIAMSLYYHTRMRDLFVGLLCAIGFCLFAYKGYTLLGFEHLENWLGGIACIAAIGTAIVPSLMHVNSECAYCSAVFGMNHVVHLICAVVLFGTLFVFLILFTCTNMDKSSTEWKTSRKRIRNKWYRSLAGAMALALAIAIIAMNVDVMRRHYVVLIGQWAALWSFSIGWMIKSGNVFIKLNDRRR